jgi:hypothetical protein
MLVGLSAQVEAKAPLVHSALCRPFRPLSYGWAYLCVWRGSASRRAGVRDYQQSPGARISLKDILHYPTIRQQSELVETSFGASAR